MKLSEAIRLGAMWKPKGTGGRSGFPTASATCAIGAAHDALGTSTDDCDAKPIRRLQQLYPWLRKHKNCPCCHCYFFSTSQVIWHLNDVERWTREQIADWVETIEPSEAPVSEVGSGHSQEQMQEICREAVRER